MSRPKLEPQWTLFEAEKQPPAQGSAGFLPNIDPHEFGWDQRVAQALEPQHVSPITPDDHKRGVFLVGAQAMGLIGRRKELQPQQLLQADVLNLGRKFTVIKQPRRATKTSGILAWLIGRCLAEPDLSVAFSIATTGKATRAKYIKEVVPALERMWPYEDDRPFKMLRGQGGERITFDNGTILDLVPFKGDSFRGDAFDIIVIDEAQDPEPEDADDVMAAIMPTLDTRPGAQVVIAGTAGYFREGNLLHDQLEEAKAGSERHAILCYEAPVDHDTVDIEALVADWDECERLVLLSHPGVHSGLTPLDAVRDNWRTLRRKASTFAAEYLGIFGKTASTAFIDWDSYQTNRRDGALPEPPAHFRYALAVKPPVAGGGQAWSIVAAWRVDGEPHIHVLATGPGTYGAYEEARRLFLKYKLPIAFDAGTSANTEVTDRFTRARPRIRTRPLTWPEVATAHAALYSAIQNRTLVHWGHEGMDQAIKDAVKGGTKDTKRWAIRGKHDDSDITTIEAAAAALKAYDDAPQPTERLGILT